MKEEFQAQVKAHYGGRCGNCGGDHKCAARLVIPADLGGQETLQNSVYLCRSCELYAATPPRAGEEAPKRLVNVWVSQTLHKAILGTTTTQAVSRLARTLVGMYLEGPPARFDDLHLYQDAASDTRLYVWLDGGSYEGFKARVQDQGLTVTAALIGLFRLYQAEMGARDERQPD